MNSPLDLVQRRWRMWQKALWRRLPAIPALPGGVEDVVDDGTGDVPAEVANELMKLTLGSKDRLRIGELVESVGDEEEGEGEGESVDVLAIVLGDVVEVPVILLLLPDPGVGAATFGHSAAIIFPFNTIPSSVAVVNATPDPPHACCTDEPIFCKPAAQAGEHGLALRHVWDGAPEMITWNDDREMASEDGRRNGKASSSMRGFRILFLGLPSLFGTAVKAPQVAATVDYSDEILEPQDLVAY
ncbi:MAG: hypothetical protein M1813_007658 [Trichoglossum hirsutum]|nr:MAG: hypothetical protein M1813_007658 [Trichoglossum hirsutum]